MREYLKYFEQLKEEVQFFPETVEEFYENSELDDMDLIYCLHNLNEEIRILRKLMRKIRKESNNEKTSN